MQALLNRARHALGGRLRRPTRQDGQALILLAFAMVGLVAGVGISVDVAVLFSARTQLIKTVDGAALAGAGQLPNAEKAYGRALEYLELNGVDVNDPNVTILKNPFIGEFLTPPRKLMDLEVIRPQPLYFLPVIGISKWNVSSGSRQGEAAPLDVMLIIDVSGSMCNDSHGGNCTASYNECIAWGRWGNCVQRETLYPQNPWRWYDPNTASTSTRRWEPFSSVQDAARQFIDGLDYRYDRVGLVSFSGRDYPYVNSNDPNAGPQEGQSYFEAAVNAPLTTQWPADFQYVKNQVGCSPGQSPGSSPYNGATHTCPNLQTKRGLFPDGWTSMGTGLREAVNELVARGRNEAQWVIVHLTDGGANRWNDDPNDHQPHICTSGSPNPIAACVNARDRVRTWGLNAQRNNIVIYAISYGADDGKTYRGTMQWLADITDNGRLDNTYLAEPDAWKGLDPPDGSQTPSDNWYYSPDVTGLDAIFQDILSKIHVRLNR